MQPCNTILPEMSGECEKMTTINKNIGIMSLLDIVCNDCGMHIVTYEHDKSCFMCNSKNITVTDLTKRD